MERKKQMSEGHLERRLVDKVRELGGLCWKFVSPGVSGVPDRFIAFDGRVVFVEMKAPGKQLRPLQRIRKTELLEQGIEVYKIDSEEGINQLIENLKTGEVHAI